jgi:hypothetical protein
VSNEIFSDTGSRVAATALLEPSMRYWQAAFLKNEEKEDDVQYRSVPPLVR